MNVQTVTKSMNKSYMIYMYIDANELWLDERTDGQREPIQFLYSFKAVIEQGGIDIAIFMLVAERCRKTC